MSTRIMVPRVPTPKATIFRWSHPFSHVSIPPSKISQISVESITLRTFVFPPPLSQKPFSRRDGPGHEDDRLR